MEEENICYCKNISEEKIVKAIKGGAKSLKEIQEKTTACTGDKCSELNPKKRCCSIDISALLEKQGVENNGGCSCYCGKD